jgi:hypothetical protein
MFSTFSHLHCTITISSVLNSNVSVVNFIKYIKTFKYYVSDDKVLDKIIQKRFVKIIYLDYNKQCSQVGTLGCRFIGTYELAMTKAAKRTYNLSRFVLWHFRSQVCIFFWWVRTSNLRSSTSLSNLRSISNLTNIDFVCIEFGDQVQCSNSAT